MYQPILTASPGKKIPLGMITQLKKDNNNLELENRISNLKKIVGDIAVAALIAYNIYPYLSNLSQYIQK